MPRRNYHPLGLPRSCQLCGEGFPENLEPLIDVTPTPARIRTLPPMRTYEHANCRAALTDDVDGFDAWAAANGEPATTLVEGAEVVVIDTIADFAFAIEVAAGSTAGRLFA